MKVDESVLFYHSGEAKEIVGLAKVKKLAYPDPTAEEGDWSAVDLVPIKPLSRAIPLAEIKGHATLKDMVFARNSRLSVSAVTENEFKTILKLSGTNL
jgi:predicted RNA-binding protein with PUA-like domain